MYDGDGRRVAQTINGVTTYFVGGHYEVTGSQVTKYYFAGTTRIAMRKYTIPQSMGVEYLLGDHLGSTSITTDANGAKVSEMRYKACPLRYTSGMLREGEVRYSWRAGQSSTPAYELTDYTYTGQYSYTADFGLMFYNARWYDPYLNHFTQPDSIIPDQYNPQDWNRYSYARNNPLRYTDPSGHIACDDQDENGKCINYEQNLFRKINKNYSNWERRILRNLYDKGGPDAMHAVDYMVANGIHIKVGTPFEITDPVYPTGPGFKGDWQSDQDVEGWYESNDFVVLNPYEGYSTDNMPDEWGLATIVHEALHIEQGGFLEAFTKDSELEAYQAGLRVYMELKGQTLSDLRVEQQELYNSSSGWDYGQNWKKYDRDGYWKGLRLLPPWWP